MSADYQHSMELLACPKCGSEWFVSSRTDERIVFQMDTGRHPVIARPEQQAKDANLIDPDHLYCGACTWKGSAEHLVESRM
jgi:uncharacterized protein YbaR (Trm112 family)